MNKIYIAIIGDIIESRKIEDRANFQKILESALIDINKKYKNKLLGKLVITSGDEIECVINDSNILFDLLSDIEASILPVKMRFGIGIGEIDIKADYEDTLKMDGTAFHIARREIDQIRKLESNNKTYRTYYSIGSSINEFEANIINSNLSLMSVIKDKWTELQEQALSVYRKNEENQYKTAQSLDISQPRISTILKSTDYYSYKNAYLEITKYIERNIKNDN